MIRLCAWHPQYFGRHTHYGNMTDTEWRPITPMVLNLIKTNQVQISHGLCEDCAKKVNEELEFEERRLEFVEKEEV